jgi:hypothetical protein
MAFFCVAVFILLCKGSFIQLSKHPRELSVVNLELKCKNTLNVAHNLAVLWQTVELSYLYI